MNLKTVLKPIAILSAIIIGSTDAISLRSEQPTDSQMDCFKFNNTDTVACMTGFVAGDDEQNWLITAMEENACNNETVVEVSPSSVSDRKPNSTESCKVEGQICIRGACGHFTKAKPKIMLYDGSDTDTDTCSEELWEDLEDDWRSICSDPDKSNPDNNVGYIASGVMCSAIAIGGVVAYTKREKLCPSRAGASTDGGVELQTYEELNDDGSETGPTT